MERGLDIILVFSVLTAAGLGLVVALAALFFGFIALFIFWWRETHRPLTLSRSSENPILEPQPGHWWESEAVFNPAAVYDHGRVHLFYRAIGRDGISRIGYASSRDGVHFDERLPHPVLEPSDDLGMPAHTRTYGPLSYNTRVYASGGGWAGFEDPRAVKIDDHVHMTFVAFDGWGFVRMALTALPRQCLKKKQWSWKWPVLLSPPGEMHKNWVLFPEKIRGKYAILHSISPKILIEYVDNLEVFDNEHTYIRGSSRGGGRKGAWDNVVLGAGPPPIKTPHGWLLFYQGRDAQTPHIGYKIGAMLLDLEDPTKVLYRSSHPVLEPTEWYENDWKPGVAYSSGAVVMGDDLIVYYGGGDKRIAAARAKLSDFLRRLMTDDHPALAPVRP